MLGHATKQRTVAKETTISDKLVETLSSNGVNSENNNKKNPFTPPFKAGFTIFATGSSNSLPVARICIFCF